MVFSLSLSKFLASRFARRLAVGLGLLLSASLLAAQTTASAYVYVQTSSGVIAYKAAANGALTRISGSPFKTAGLLAGSTGIAFYSVGTDYIHAYKVLSNGAIGSQISQVNTQSHPGGNCGTAAPWQPGVLDHSGKYFYNFLQTFGTCSVYQTYNLASTGALSFNNYTRIDTANSGPNAESTTEILAILGNESYAYAILSTGHDSNIIGFKREASGALQYIPITENDPSNVPYGARSLAADPTNHIAALTFPNFSVPPQLVSYTADSSGNLTSTNISSNAPYVDLNAAMIAMSPSGLLVAVPGGDAPSYAPQENGLEILHFNGAQTPTKYKMLLPGVSITRVMWDRSNHLYAVADLAQKIYVYTVTPTSISAVPGSPFAIGAAPTALFVKSLK